MKRFSAQFIITNTGPVLKRGIVTTDNEGKILDIEDTGGELRESASVEFFNGIIIPGFVNCHCHLELSHMKGSTARSAGLPGFIEEIRNKREESEEKIAEAARQADRAMYEAGVNLCADICNTPLTFNIKRAGSIRYVNLLEVFGIDPAKAERRMKEAVSLAVAADRLNLTYYIVPHSAYSLSLTLFRLLREKTENNRITSIHFMESPGERALVEDHDGPLMISYKQSGLISETIETAGSHSDAVLREITRSGNLILVHNTFVTGEIVRKVRERQNLYWCLCPGSNLYIENTLPPADLLSKEGCTITIGTDSLASNNTLEPLEELKLLQENFRSLTLTELVKWATINGARALGEEESFGSLRPGTKPGLVLLENTDLINMKLLPGTRASRLV